MKKLKIYLDSCCFNRPFDDLSQDKVRFECEAVLAILKNCDDGVWSVFKSDILDDEIDRIINSFKKLKVLMLYSSASMHIEINGQIITRAKELQHKINIKPFDALHLASAEYGDADIFLTTDKKFLNRATESDSKIKIANPAVWLMEVMFNG
ncbi:MAG: PIN domain-containing protein [Defluviitaleaceae bacterium]|nr:PIN domain-containing protein [Defluviitaleaceae bacterium]